MQLHTQGEDSGTGHLQEARRQASVTGLQTLLLLLLLLLLPLLHPIHLLLFLLLLLQGGFYSFVEDWERGAGAEGHTVCRRAEFSHQRLTLDRRLEHCPITAQ